jgi:hypothetical protein
MFAVQTRTAGRLSGPVANSWSGCILISWQINDCQNLQIEFAVLLIYFRTVVSCVPLSSVCQFVKLNLILPEPLLMLLYCFGNCAHHPTWLAIFTQLALLGVFIMLTFPILLNVGTSNIA